MSPQMIRELTERQREVLHYIVEVLRCSGYPPTVREIANHFGLASGYGVQRHLAALQKKGFIRRDTGARTITLSPAVAQALDHTEGLLLPTQSPPNATLVPLVGQVAAGLPITAEQNVEEFLAMPNEWVQNRGSVYMLRVKGDSMAPGIEDGDLVLVREQATAENGALVVACIDGEATVKRFFRERTHIVLRPDNPHYDDIVVKQEMQLNGKVIGLVRMF